MNTIVVLAVIAAAAAVVYLFNKADEVKTTTPPPVDTMATYVFDLKADGGTTKMRKRLDVGETVTVAFVNRPENVRLVAEIGNGDDHITGPVGELEGNEVVVYTATSDGAYSVDFDVFNDAGDKYLVYGFFGDVGDDD